MKLRVSSWFVFSAVILVGGISGSARGEVVAGYPDPFSHHGVHGANFLLAQKLTISESATVEGVGIIYKQAIPGKSSKVGLYSDNSGSPGTLLALTAAFPQVTGATEAPLINPIELSGDLWFVALHEGAGNPHIGEAPSGPVTVFYRSYAFGNPLPNTFGLGSLYADTQINYYLTGTIPEPCTVTLLSVGAAGMLGVRRRKLRRN